MRFFELNLLRKSRRITEMRKKLQPLHTHQIYGEAQRMSAAKREEEIHSYSL